MRAFFIFVKMEKSIEILKKYWGFDKFRYNQEEIINSIYNNIDTLAILPTGGGKTICYQIPALLKDGLCIVISPLISLINEQNEETKIKGIKSIAISSEMNYNQIEISLENCIYGNYKFLYISPEKLQNTNVINKISKMNVNLIAVDESHCISEWGNDFRPSYRKIAKLREIHQNVPILALTATATNDVANDIQKNLEFKKNNIIKSSLFRSNISYNIIKEEIKEKKLISILNRIKNNTSIVYVKTRKDCLRINEILKKNNIKSNYYHAGLSISDRNKIQGDWKNNTISTIVATNAFGMGINKKDVKVVIHMHIPNSIESYFQECGRVGRNGSDAYTILLYNSTDVKILNEMINQYELNIEQIRAFYQNIANYLQIPVNSGANKEFEFNINEFCVRYEISKIKFNSIFSLLESNGYIQIKNNNIRETRIRVIVSKEELSKFQKNNNILKPHIKTLLRTYPNIFNQLIQINEDLISAKLKISVDEIKSSLIRLEKLEIIEYNSFQERYKIKYLQNRIENKYLMITNQRIEEINLRRRLKLKSMIQYCEQNDKCRMNILLNYFGEKSNENCNKCDVCRN
tara:strand:+ start:4384 stop:6114 length:1731 start_codon:yes stop_codon:yes gene_type:complete